MMYFGDRKKVFGKKEEKIEELVSGILMIFLGLSLGFILINAGDSKFILLLIPVMFTILGLYFLLNFFKKRG